MKNKKLVLIFIFISGFVGIIFFLNNLFSTNNEISYSYNGVTVKRIDTNGKTTFKCIGDKGQNFGEIYTTYSGINDGFEAYLKFNTERYKKDNLELNNSVEIIVADGVFYGKDNSIGSFDATRCLIMTENLDSLKKNDLVCEIKYPDQSEQEWNKKKFSNSKIKITYKK